VCPVARVKEKLAGRGHVEVVVVVRKVYDYV
jgi:hypothetical protein